VATTERQAPAEGGHLIKRPRLTRMLDESKARVILLVAPAGYGKTTLAREWLEDKPHVWYRASSADADVAALAVGLASAAAAVVPGVDRRIKQRVRALRDPEREAPLLVELVAEDLARLPEETWLAVDDYQCISESPTAERFMTDLLDSTPFPILATSRSRPAWATARGVVYGGAAVLDRADLEMTDDEVRETVGRTRAEVPTLFENATGWPAIVGLAARVGPGRLEGHTLPADLHDFFAEELWQFIDAKEQWQLAQLALVVPVSKRVAEQIVGGDDATDLFEHMTQAGWLTRDRAEVVIHPLLARFLRQRFEQFPARLREEAVSRLIATLGAEEEWDRAMEIALDENPATVPSVLEQSLEGLLSGGRLPTIERWLQIARDRRIESAVLKLAAAEVSFRRGDYSRAEVLARAAAAGSSSEAFRARSLTTAGHSARRLERLDSALELYRAAREVAVDDAVRREAVLGEILTSLDLGVSDQAALLARMPADDGSVVNRLRRVSVEGQIALWLGEAGAQLATSDSCVSLVDDIDDPLARTSFLYTRAFLLTAAAHYRDALETCAALEREATAYRIDFALLELWLPRATAEAGLRNFGLARRIVDDKLSQALRDRDQYGLANAAALIARIEVATCSQRVPELRAELNDPSSPGWYAEYMLSLALAEAVAGNVDRSRALKAEALKSVMDAESKVLAAWVDAVQTPADRELVTAALQLTLRHGYVDRFVVAYRGCPQIAETLAADPQLRDEFEAIAIRANDLEIAQRLGLKSAARNTRRNRLTRREREVYALMVNGLSNRAIAQRLFITEPTAKLHVRHILAKLSARSRAEAVAKWRDVLDDR
jgi:LuxR family transcriptional regulator, maltose regulon positive regulatory protein